MGWVAGAAGAAARQPRPARRAIARLGIETAFPPRHRMRRSRAGAASGLLAGRAELRGGRRGLGDALALSLQLALVGELEGGLLTNKQPGYSGRQQWPVAAHDPSNGDHRKDRDRVRLKPAAAAAGAPSAHRHDSWCTTWQRRDPRPRPPAAPRTWQQGRNQRTPLQYELKRCVSHISPYPHN